MPSEMYQRGKHDAEADALDESFYQYYYDYRLAYDEVTRQRRWGRRRLLVFRTIRFLPWIAAALVLIIGGSFFAYRASQPNSPPLAELIQGGTATPTPSPTLRPTLIPPTEEPTITPTSLPELRASSFAVITGTNNAPLRVHKSPGKNTPTPGRLSPGKQVEILEGPQQADGLTWWRVKGDESQGWVAGDYLAPVTKP